MHYNCDKAAVSDQITDALSYQTAYEIIAVEMMKRSHLLEHVGLRMLDALYAAFPQLLYAKIKISKMNPPLGGQIRYLCPAKSQKGRLAERLGSGLQNRVQQFKSATDLKSLRKLSFEGFFVSGILKGRAAGVLVPPISSEKGTLITTNRSMGLSGSCPFYILCFNGVHGILHLQSGQNHCTLSVC